MSCIIKASTKVNIGIKITNYYIDKSTSSSTLFIGDTIENLEYTTEDSQVKYISGKLTKIDTTIISVSKNFNMVNDIKVGSISIESFDDDRTITIVSPDNINAFNTDDNKEFDYTMATPVMTVDFNTLHSDGSKSSITLKTGMELNNIQIQKTKSSVRGNYIIKSFMYKIDKANYTHGPLVYGMVLIGDGEERVIFENIKSYGSEGIQIESDEDINDVISSITDIDMVDLLLPVADFPEAILITKDVSLVGNNANVNASIGNRATDDIDDSETVLLNTITCEKNTNVIFRGITFTDNVYIDPNGATSLTFKNCKFVETEPNAVKSYLFNDRNFRGENDRPLLLHFEGCYFGSNTTVNDNSMYNLLEIHSRLADGSYIKNCYFAENCANHNLINLYDVEDDATIEISGNHFEKSANAVRIGFINHPKCKVIIKDNTYDKTDNDKSYAGLLLVQPYGKQTETFKDVTIELKNNKYLNGDCQDGYLYFYDNDTQLTLETSPVVHTDGYFNFGFE